MFKNFENYIWGMMGLEGSWNKLVRNLSDKLIELRKNPNNTEVVEINPDKLISMLSSAPNGRFYLIQYNFNGNLIWCPILGLDYKVYKNKHILYALNLEYLPPRYKMLLFNKIFKLTHKKMELNAQKKMAKNEPNMKFMTFKFMYEYLKKNGKMHYAITAYTIKDFDGNYKIKKCYLCSTKILPEIIMADMKRINRANMMQLQKKLSGEPQTKLGDILEQFDKIIESYQADSIQYHKDVALFEKKLKLF